MRIFDVARELGISAAWLRRLERQGKIPAAPRDLNGDRRYTQRDVEQLRRLLFEDGRTREAGVEGRASP